MTTPDGVAVVLTCRCGKSVETTLTREYYLYLVEPPGWYVDIREQGEDSVVRCPEHRQVTG